MLASKTNKCSIETQRAEGVPEGVYHLAGSHGSVTFNLPSVDSKVEMDEQQVAKCISGEKVVE